MASHLFGGDSAAVLEADLIGLSEKRGARRWQVRCPRRGRVRRGARCGRHAEGNVKRCRLDGSVLPMFLRLDHGRSDFRVREREQFRQAENRFSPLGLD